MNNKVISIKIKQRLNKLDSSDYDNLMTWQIIEAFNKAQLDWCRRQIHGYNLLKEGDEESLMRIDDLQVLLSTKKIPVNPGNVFNTVALPKDYLYWKNVNIEGSTDCCGSAKFVVYLSKVEDEAINLRNKNTRPSYEWRETFCTLVGNNVRIYHNKEFSFDHASLTYYRKPSMIEIKGTANPLTQIVSTKEVECEFKDDIVEIIIMEAAKIISLDIENMNINRSSDSAIEENN